MLTRRLVLAAAAFAFVASLALSTPAQTGAKGTPGSKADAANGGKDASRDAKDAGKDDPKTKKAAKASGRKGEGEAPAGPADYASKNFVVHTDLTPEEAKDLLQRLETMLVIISKYWGRPNRQIIELYVVKDINKWPSGSIDPRAIESVQGGGGITLGRVRSFAGAVAARAPAYAVADRGTPQHEAVHAYCIQTFGTTGPVWYAEGMAEMGQYWKDGEKAVNCHEIVSDYLRKSRPKSLNEIVNADEATGDSWQNYAWRWALCHLLATNENYAPRFRPLGIDLLTKQTSSFEEIYGPMAKEISFEYVFFLKHVAPGFRCDLCSWDWKAKYKLARGSTATTATIEAGRGWQPTRALVKKDEEYQFSASGTWKTSKEGEGVDADGDDEGTGRLVGILFDDYELSEEFELGAYGTFTAPGDGQLLVRCRDEWTALGDNSGKLTVRIASASGRPLPEPKDRVKRAAKQSGE